MALTELGIARGPTPLPVETRGAGNYTDQLLSGSYLTATGRLHAASLAGVQVAAGIIGRALASATVEGDSGAVGPQLLEAVGTDLVRAGRFLGRLTVGPAGRLRIIRSASLPSVIYGSADPDSWVYWLQEDGPSDSRTVRATAAEVINVRINSDSRRPWEGCAPLAQAAASGQLAARLASSLGDEADIVVSRIIPIAQGSGRARRISSRKRSAARFLVDSPFLNRKWQGAAPVGQVRRSEILDRQKPVGIRPSPGRSSTRTCSAKCAKSAAYPARS